jgi:type I restriction enzyme S subunit
MTRTVLLGNIGRIVTGKTPPNAHPEYWGNELDFITPTDFADSKYIKPKRRLSTEGKRALQRIVCPTNSVVVTCIGSDMGKVALAKNDYVSNQQINSLIIDEGQANQEFIYYLLKFNRPLLRKYAESNGSTMPIINKTSFEKLSFDIPNIQTQKKIADILGVIDEKIELNRKMNETLEQMGQALFKHYFITNPQVENWGKRKLGDVLELRGGLSYKAGLLSDNESDMPMVTMGCVSGKYRINLGAVKRYHGEYKAQHLLNPGDIFIATRDVTQDRVLIGSPAIIPKVMGQAICATNLYKVVLKQEISIEFLYQLMRTQTYREQIIASAKGSTIVMLTKDSVLNYRFRVDFSSVAYESYIKQAEIIRQEIDANSEEIQTLATLRDTLLPRLISGKLKV